MCDLFRKLRSTRDKIMSLSIAEENYLKAIYKLSERYGSPVNTNAIARVMKTAPASVTDMLKKLAKKDLISYQKYYGGSLADRGKKLATELIRRHRLWESFLVDKLGFEWDEVHIIAEELEHVDSQKLVDRLDEFLGHPKFDPHGDPIPDREGRYTLRVQYPLCDLEPGESGTVVGVLDHQDGFLQVLRVLDIQLGTKISVLELFDFDESVKISINDKEHIVSNQISTQVYVKK